jgi:hypothetical protein
MALRFTRLEAARQDRPRPALFPDNLALAPSLAALMHCTMEPKA